VFNTTALAQGASAVNVTASQTDSAGNTGNATPQTASKDTGVTAASCVFSPDPANTGTTVTATCTGVETGGTVTIPGMTCGAEAGNTVTCTGPAENIGDNPTITTTDSGSNTTNSTGSFDLDDTLPVVVITAPTTLNNAAITNTTIQVTDAGGITASNVTVAGSTTATTSAYSCTQTDANTVDLQRQPK